jgi:hypothetical protein
MPYNPNYRTLRPPPTVPGQTTQSSAQTVANQRNAWQQQLQAQSQVMDVAGTFDLTGIGEATSTEIQFPYLFVAKPIFTFGSELQTNQAPTTGAFPTVSATVSSWDTKPAGNATTYIGATIITVTTGPASLLMTIHYCFRGYAINLGGTGAPSNTTGTA